MTRSGAGRGRPPGPARHRRAEGFSLIELLVVMTIVGVTLGIGVIGYRTYQSNTSTLRAAEVFRMDLTTARSVASRERRWVAIEFDEANRSYALRTSEGRVIHTRGFAQGGEIPLSSIALDLPDSRVVFSARGFADLSGAGSPLGVARFEVAGSGHEVRFNTTGAAEIVPF